MTAWPQASSLQDCKRINFCCFKTPGLWYLVTAALGTYLYSRCANMSWLWQPQGSDTMTSQQRWAYLIPRLSFLSIRISLKIFSTTRNHPCRNDRCQARAGEQGEPETSCAAGSRQSSRAMGTANRAFTKSQIISPWITYKLQTEKR